MKRELFVNVRMSTEEAKKLDAIIKEFKFMGQGSYDRSSMIRKLIEREYLNQWVKVNQQEHPDPADQFPNENWRDLWEY